MPARAKPAFKVDFFSPVCGNPLLKVDEPTLPVNDLFANCFSGVSRAPLIITY